jgi:hypothetical protein
LRHDATHDHLQFFIDAKSKRFEFHHVDFVLLFCFNAFCPPPCLRNIKFPFSSPDVKAFHHRAQVTLAPQLMAWKKANTTLTSFRINHLRFVYALLYEFLIEFSLHVAVAFFNDNLKNIFDPLLIHKD